MKMHSASGSCSAWATRSEAMQAGSPSALMITASVGPARNSMAQSNATSFLAAVTYRLPGTDDFVHARNFFSSVSKGGDGLRSTDSVELAHAEECRRRQSCLGRARRRHANLFHAGDLRGNYRHEQRRWQRIAAARDVASHRFQRAHQLAYEDAGLDFAPPLFVALVPWALATPHSGGCCPQPA